jgi:hypothetical protein
MTVTVIMNMHILYNVFDFLCKRLETTQPSTRFTHNLVLDNTRRQAVELVGHLLQGIVPRLVLLVAAAKSVAFLITKQRC